MKEPSAKWRYWKPRCQAAACVAVSARWVDRMEAQLEDLEFKQLLDPEADLSAERATINEKIARARRALDHAYEIARAVGVDPDEVARRARARS